MMTPTFYFIISMRTISSVTEKNISGNLWLLFLANKIKVNKYYRERVIMGPATLVQIVFPLKDKKMQGI